MTRTFDHRIDGTNAAETLTGDGGSDEIYGYGGDDWLDGWAWGYDRLDGGTGADTMVGGVEGVTFVVDNIGDVVIVHPEGYFSDTVESSISFPIQTILEYITKPLDLKFGLKQVVKSPTSSAPWGPQEPSREFRDFSKKKIPKFKLWVPSLLKAHASLAYASGHKSICPKFTTLSMSMN